MKYTNKEFGFSLTMADDWDVVDDKQFFIKKLQMPSKDANGMLCFGMRREKGKIVKTFNITRDAVYANPKEYEEGIKLNILNMEKMGAKILSHNIITTKSKLRFNHIMVKMYDSLFSQYYTALPNGLMICGAIDVHEIRDMDDIFMYGVMSTLEF